MAKAAAKAKKPATGAKRGRPKKPVEAAAETAKAAPAEPKAKAGHNSSDLTNDERALFLHHLEQIKKGKARAAGAGGDLRNLYKKAKGDGGFTKADFEFAIEMEEAEKEARAKARIARQGTIARAMGAKLGRELQLDMFVDREPASDIAFDEGKMAALSKDGVARPKYDPSTEQHRRYMEGYHSVSEERIKKGIKPTEHPEVKADQEAKTAAKAKVEKQKAEDQSAFEQKVPVQEAPPSGVAMSRADFIRQQQMKAAQQQQDEPDEDGSAFQRAN